MITNFKIFEIDKYSFEIKKEAKDIIKNYDPIVSKYPITSLKIISNDIE